MNENQRAARSRASTKYNAENVKQIKLNLNRKTDADIIAQLEDSGNIQGYIKKLIRRDITMQRYRVMDEYVDKWTNESVDELIVTEDEVNRLCREWGMTFEELKMQIEEL